MRWISFVLLVLLTGCGDSGPKIGIKKGNIAPVTKGIDLDGKPISLADYKGKVVLLDFWATWCPPCVMSIPHEKGLLKTYGTEKFAILGVSYDRSPQDLREFLSEVPLPWSNIFEGAAEIAETWELEAYPTFVLIDHQGIVRARWTGAQALKSIEAKIAELLREMDAGKGKTP